MSVIVSTSRIFMFVDQLLLVDVFSQLYNLAAAKMSLFFGKKQALLLVFIAFFTDTFGKSLLPIAGSLLLP